MSKFTLLSLPHDIFREIFSFLLPVHHQTANTSSNNFINLQIDEVKKSILSLQSTCSFFLSESLEISNYFNEFWLSLMEREFLGHSLLQEEKKLREKIKKKAKRYYCMLVRMLQIQYEEQLIPIMKKNESNSVGNINQNSQMNVEDLKCKIFCIGEYGSGKSSLCRVLSGEFFNSPYEMQIEDTYLKEFRYSDAKYQLEIVDTYAMDEYVSLQDRMIQISDIILLTIPPQPYWSNYSKDNQKSIEHSYNFLDKLLQRIVRIREVNNSPIIIVFTKCDITYGEHDEKTRELYVKRVLRKNMILNCSIVHTSARDGVGIAELLVEMIIRYRTTTETKDFKYGLQKQY
ncbi:ras family member [Naegleria gruberi]|uniref:Ras family member n=1 Tax=Naegleria gruberi TaxID=5762 RepID=D2VJ62_NAEGR|nr:ras family member [Naegleria gruberi]EFC43224.1 ras family member [Naegleria gruberi]|eukprot:XP_002675968.1 ras family member [Naegleria gruberi strain NEG-M]